MARRPSERRNFKDEEMELNLTPFMNMIAILIPVLLISTAFVEIAVINVAAPAIGTSASSEDEKPKGEKPPLNLTVTVTDKGYTIAGSGDVVAPAGKGQGGPTFPIIQKLVSCQKYLATVPPPRAKNQGAGKCTDPDAERTFWVYDTEALARKLLEIKDAFPDEQRMIIAAEAEIGFEAITDVMDAGREHKDPGGEVRQLFPEVVLSPGLS